MRNKELIRLEQISKEIKGAPVLKNINLEFKTGMIYGLHGINGSGKTMLLRMIAGLIRPTEGKVFLDGKLLHKDLDFPQSMGVVIENPDFWHNYTGLQVLRTLAAIKKTASERDLHTALERVGLSSEDGRTVRKYSLGMKQRLGIAQAIMERPDILLLDEPTNALDKEGIIQIQQILKEEAGRGAVVILASHNAADLQVCDVLIEMEQGKVVSRRERRER